MVGENRHRLRRSSRLALAGLVFSACLTQQADAAGWQYCLALTRADHTAYFNAPDVETPAGEQRFRDGLERRGLPIGLVQCPRADDLQMLVEMENYAIRHNEKIGNRVISLRPN